MRREGIVMMLLVAGVVLPVAGASAQAPQSHEQPSAPASGSAFAPPSSNSAPVQPIASASDIPQQVVWLRSGAIIRGQVVEYVPDTRVVLQLATGEVRTIAWDQVQRASWVASPAPPPATSTPTPPASAARPAAAGILLHLEGDRPDLWLETRPRYGNGKWSQLCDAPCGTVLDVHRKSLRVSGPDVRPSNSFHIEERSGEETLDVSAGSASTHRWGQRSLVAGIGLALASGIVFGLGRVEDEDAAVVGGAIGLALGGIGIAVALPILGSSTTVVRNGEGERVGAGRCPRGQM